MSESETGPRTSNSGAAGKQTLQRFWPRAAIGFGLGLTAAWVCLLGYAVAKLIEMAI